MTLMDYFGRNILTDLLAKCRNSRRLILIIVFIALFLDNMLLTTVGKYQRQIFKFLQNETKKTKISRKDMCVCVSNKGYQ